ncbi:hypothetical protein PFMALIP_03258 [Plasmodium falciparum MaliPS096_E11]|uniref:Insulinase n=1 Tax=Plasmodium falciparum MaliPS096_E11 TaxID=1036727 RepID=A0A024WPT5_PLAFA|nr:hypothetical protein PFMALIP_03258 [Plasmodium falciparum MaliPS096_E11]
MYDYVRINSIKLEQDLEVEEYYSLDSGLRIILNKTKSPKIYGFFTLLTEAENDEGLPHTLEHLIFLGSHKYPYKGLLDFLAYKCLSEGTNAWTAIDHTCYTIETFGIEGFCNILPIYLDFILNPTLENNMFLSEVHHIFENGTHNGVVYSEMKSIENNCENIVERTVITNLYPSKKGGYRYETGGTLEGLRQTNNNRVREYFKKFYKLNNFAIIIFGNFKNDVILDIIHKFEEYHLELNPSQKKQKIDINNYYNDQNMNDLIKEENDNICLNKEGKKKYIYDIKKCKELFLKDIQSNNRPWRRPENIEKREGSLIIKKYYPCNNLNNGQVTIAWRGCPWEDVQTKLAISLLGNYLTDLTTSPVSKRLLEDKETYCSSLDFSLEDLKENYFSIDIYDVSYKYKCHKIANAMNDHNVGTNMDTQKGITNINQNDHQNDDEKYNQHEVNNNNDDDHHHHNDDYCKNNIKNIPCNNTQDNKNVLKPSNEKCNINVNPSNTRNDNIKMNVVADITRNCLNEVYEKPLNMDRLKNIIKRSYLQHLRDLETSPHYLLNEILIKYFIYGSNICDLEKCLNLKKIYIQLLNEDEKYWKDILKRYILQNDYVEVRCYPSVKKAKKIESFEKKLIEMEQQKYGMEKLNKMVENIKKIKENIEKKPPKGSIDIVESAKPRNVYIEGITVFRNFKSLMNEPNKTDEQIFANVKATITKDDNQYNQNNDNYSNNSSTQNFRLLKKLTDDLKRIIFPIQLSNIYSNFVCIHVLINSKNIDKCLKPYLPLLSYLMFETDIVVNNKNIKCENFIEEMIRNTINYDCNFGLGENAKNFKAGSLGNIICIQIVGLLENYEKLFDLLFLSIFKMNLTLHRLEIILKSAYQNLLQKKNKPKTLVINLEYALRYMKNSNSGLVSIGQQELILKLIENKNNLLDVYNKLNLLKDELFNLKNIALILVTRVNLLNILTKAPKHNNIK